MQNKWPCTHCGQALGCGQGRALSRSCMMRAARLREWIIGSNAFGITLGTFPFYSSSLPLPPSSSAVATRLLNMLQTVLVACIHP